MEKMQQLPGIDKIGCGYDVLNGYYANELSCLLPLFDFPSDQLDQVSIGDKTFSKPNIIVCQTAFATLLNKTSGKTIEQYKRRYQNELNLGGKFLFFSSSLKTDFNESCLSIVSSAFTRIQHTVCLYTLQLRPAEFMKVQPITG